MLHQGLIALAHYQLLHENPSKNHLFVEHPAQCKVQRKYRIEIDQSLLSEEKTIIEEAIIDAMKSAHEISTSTMKDRMEDLTGGFKLNLPGMGDEN